MGLRMQINRATTSEFSGLDNPRKWLGGRHLVRIWPALLNLLVIGIALINPAAAMTLEERTQCARAVEAINWTYRIWPETNVRPKPTLEEVFPESAARSVAEDSVKMTQALESRYGRRIDASVLQRELARMAGHTQAADQLQAMFNAVGNDASRAAECIARPHLARRWLMESYSTDSRSAAQTSFDDWWRSERIAQSGVLESVVIKDPLPMVLRDGVAQKFGPDEWRTLRPRTPSARLDHTMVWTGTEVIVWGGSDIDNELLNTGGRYHPATDTWFATSPVGAPSPRQNHSAVWTGTEMIVWGGSATQTGGRYNPATDSWMPTNTTGAPAARNFHSAIWTGSLMVVWGGSIGTPYLDTGGRYDPTTDSWTPTSVVNTPTPRQYHGVVWTGNEMIVWGGTAWINDTPVRTNTGGRYNPANDSWTTTATTNAPAARNLQPGQAVWTGTEMFVWGGFTSSLTNTGARYNPASNSWLPTSTTNAPTARQDHNMVWTGSEVIVWGGSNPLTGSKYQPTTNSWIAMSTSGAPPNAHDARAIWTGTEMIVWGGRDDSQRIQQGGRYDDSTDSWIPTSINHPPKRRYQHTATWTGVEMVIWGGTPFAGINGYGQARYHAATDSWLPASSPPAANRRLRAASVWTGTHVMVWGGVNSSGIRQKDGILYNPATDTWTETSTVGAPAEREDHTLIWTGQEAIVWGGSLIGGARTDTGGRYNPTSNSWLPTNLVNAPAARQGHTSVWTGTAMLVWGGRSSSVLNSGSLYLPASDSWQPLAIADAPAPRELHSAVWTGSEMIVWGGQGSGARLNDGGRYNPASATWSSTSLVDAPEARQEHTAVWSGTEMIVWGGWRFDGASVFPSAGGRYSPVTDSWVPTSALNAPAGRRFHTAVWTGDSMVIWGGEDIDGRTTDEFAAYYPTLAKQGTQTRIASVSPNPSNPNAPVTVTVLVSALATAPANGTVNITASTGETCADASATTTWVNSATFSCQLVFATPGNRQVTANFFSSPTHQDSVSTPVGHSVVIQEGVFANGFEN